MIWHIFRKDWKLLWPMAVPVALAQILCAAFWFIIDRGGQPRSFVNVAQLFPVIAMIGSAVLALSAVQTDSLPGDREDWLVRPIRRLDLLLAKLIFILIVIIGPIFLAAATEMVLDGFPLAASAGAALGGNVFLTLCVLCLPAAMLGTVTRNLSEGIVGGVIVVAAIAVFVAVVNIGGEMSGLGWGLNWIIPAVVSGIAVAAALIVLPLQYFRRWTIGGRVLIAGAFLLAFLALFFPFGIAFKAQQALAAVDTKGRDVAIAYDPSFGRGSRTLPPNFHIAGKPVSLVNLPVQVTGVNAGEVLWTDGMEIRLIAEGNTLYDGNILYHDRVYVMPSWVRQDGGDGDMLRSHQQIILPASVLGHFRDQKLTLEIDYSLSLFRKDATAAFAAAGDDQHVDKIGWCKTAIDVEGDDVDLKCEAPGQLPACILAILENPATGLRNPETFNCLPSYAPFPMRFAPDALARFGAELKFRDLNGLAKYPVDTTQLAAARVSLTSYQPTAHFTRHVVIPNIRLSDWEAEPGP